MFSLCVVSSLLVSNTAIDPPAAAAAIDREPRALNAASENASTTQGLDQTKNTDSQSLEGNRNSRSANNERTGDLTDTQSFSFFEDCLFCTDMMSFVFWVLFLSLDARRVFGRITIEQTKQSLRSLSTSSLFLSAGKVFLYCRVLITSDDDTFNRMLLTLVSPEPISMMIEAFVYSMVTSLLSVCPPLLPCYAHTILSHVIHTTILIV